MGVGKAETRTSAPLESASGNLVVMPVVSGQEMLMPGFFFPFVEAGENGLLWADLNKSVVIRER